MKQVFLFLFIASYTVTNGQDYDIKWIEPIDSSYGKVKIVHYDASGYYILTEKYAGGVLSDIEAILLMKYDKNGNELARINVSNIPTSDEYKIDTVFGYNSNIILVSEQQNDETEKRKLTLEVFDNELKPIKKTAIINLKATSARKTKTFLSVSPNMSKFSFLYSTATAGNSNANFGVTVFDSMFSKLYSTEQLTSTPNNKHHLLGIEVDNSGNAFVLCKEKRPRKSYPKGTPDTKTTLYKFQKNISVIEKEIKIDNLFLGDMMISQNHKENIIITGLWGDKSCSNKIDLNRIGGGGKKSLRKSFGSFAQLFSGSDLSRINTEKNPYKWESEKDFPAFDVRNIYRTKNNFFVSTWEHVYIRQSYSSSATIYGSIYTNVRDSEGKMIFEQIIAKSQVYGPDYHPISFFFKEYNNELYFIYNDNRNNIDKNSTTTKGLSDFTLLSMASNYHTVAVKFNEDGEREKILLSESKDIPFNLAPVRFFSKNGSDKIITYRKYSKIEQIGVLKL